MLSSSQRLLWAVLVLPCLVRQTAWLGSRPLGDQLRQFKLQTRHAAGPSAIELMLLPSFTSKGMIPPAASQPPPVLQLPDGKRSIFDSSMPLKQTDVTGSPDLLPVIGQFLDRLVHEFEPLDAVSAALFLLALCLGLLYTERRWLSYAEEALAWYMYQLQGDALKPARLVFCSSLDLEQAQASWPRLRRLCVFLSEARVPDQLRAAAAVIALKDVEPRLAGLGEALASACSRAWLPDDDSPLPSMDGDWETGCDFYKGNVVSVLLRVRGRSAEYVADNKRHRVSDISYQRQGRLAVASFRWTNSDNTATGQGQWLLDANADFMAGSFSQDGLEGGPWSWYGRRKPRLGTPPPPGFAQVETVVQAQANTRQGDLEAEVVKAAAAMASSLSEAPAEVREAIAVAFESTSPEQPSGTGGELSRTADLQRYWMDAGSDLRMVLGLTAEGLVDPKLQYAATVLSVLSLSLLSLFLARLVALAVGGSGDTFTWAAYTASWAVLLDVTGRRDGLMQLLRKPEEAALRKQRLSAFCAWANSGALLRRGSAPRAEVLEYVRQTVFPESSASVQDSEIEELLKVWHPGLRKQAIRISGNPAPMMSYKNVSLGRRVEPPGSIWR